MKELNRIFQIAVARLNLAPLRPLLYSFRHGGASEDLALRRRSMEQVMRRGRWASTSSLKRYAKETRLLKEMGKIDEDVFAWGRRVEASFPSFLLMKPGSQALLQAVPVRCRAAALAQP